MPRPLGAQAFLLPEHDLAHANLQRKVAVPNRPLSFTLSICATQGEAKVRCLFISQMAEGTVVSWWDPMSLGIAATH
jgi:hypothetical protein